MSGGRREDPRRLLEWLVPEGGEVRARAERVVAFTRAVGRSDPQPAELGPREARQEFEVEGRARAAGAMEDLLVHHLHALQGGASFLQLPAPRAGVQAAWETLTTLRESLAFLPGVPGPGEGALAVAGRLLGGLYQLGWDEATLELWRARLEHASGGARAGERAFRERLGSTPAKGRGSRTFPSLLAGLVGCLLDRGAVREALAQFEEHRGLRCLAEDRDLRQLLLWTRVCGGDLEGAADLRGGRDFAAGAPPRAMIELRGDWPSSLRWLEGLEAQAPEQDAFQDEVTRAPTHSRHDCGASVLAVFAFCIDRGVEVLHLDLAPAMRGRAEAWLREREGACCVRTCPEHALLIEAAPQRLHGEKLPSSLGRGARALALTPVHDEEGEVAGWMHLEFEHHLVPDRARLARWAASWRLPILRRGGGAGLHTLHLSDRVSEQRSALEGWAPRDAAERLRLELGGVAAELCAEVFQALARALGLKLRQRRWWAFVLERGQPRFVGSGGEGLDGLIDAAGGGRALDRCLAAGGVVAFEEPDERLAIHRGSASGIVLPLLEDGRVVALFAVESSRKNDFHSLDLEQLTELVDAFSLPLSMARFRAWHLERYGFDLFFDTGQPAFREFSERVFAAARASSPLVLSGPAGAGKGVVARWVQWCAGNGEHELDVFHSELDPSGEESRREWLQRLRERRGCLLLESVADLPAQLQEEVLRALEGDGVDGPQTEGRPFQLIVTTSSSLADCVEGLGLRADLAARLDRFQVYVPALTDRRRDIPGLARFFVARFAAEEGCAEPILSDEALGLLWRQPWPRNLRDLEAFVFKLVLMHPGEEVGVEHLQSLARRFKLVLRDKLPSRRPRRRDLLQALRTTLTSTGRCNKRRAAAYLGWDPDTLVARMRDAGIDAADVADEPDSWLS